VDIILWQHLRNPRSRTVKFWSIISLGIYLSRSEQLLKYFLLFLSAFALFLRFSVNRINRFVFVRITPIWVLFGQFFVTNLVFNSF